MQAQYEFSRGEPFRTLLSSVLDPERFKQDFIIGVTIDFHPLWWSFYTTWHDMGGIDYHYFYFPDWSWPWPRRFIPRPDPTWNSEFWNRICEDHKKDPHPFIVRICFAPGADPETRVRLVNLAREQSFFCIVEERPMARAASSFDGGRDITADEPGTLGGFFQDLSTSKIFGVTCAHVAQTKGLSVSGEDSLGIISKKFGTVKETSYHQLNVLAPGQACNRSTATKASTSGVFTPIVDAALIELDSTHTALKTIPSIGTIDAIYDRTQFGSGDRVEMRGAQSKHNSFLVGAYDAVYKVMFNDGHPRCFEHMFEINRQSLASTLVPPALAAKPVAGDSGACVCCPSSTGNYAYCGTLVAADGTTGYACFAESVRDWAKSLSPSVDLAPL